MLQECRRYGLGERVDREVNRPPRKRNALPPGETELLKMLPQPYWQDGPKKVVGVPRGRRPSQPLEIAATAPLRVSLLPEIRHDFGEIEWHPQPAARLRAIACPHVRQRPIGVGGRLPAADSAVADRLTEGEVSGVLRHVTRRFELRERVGAPEVVEKRVHRSPTGSVIRQPDIGRTCRCFGELRKH